MSAKKIFTAFTASTCVLLPMLLFLSAPARYAQSISTGISLWAVNVLPATFPFLFLTALLTKMCIYALFSKKIAPAASKVFRVSGTGGGIAVLAALSGYPIGARMIFDLYEAKKISNTETFRLAALCSTSGPMFVVGTVGSIMFESASKGWVMLISHLCAVWLVCILLRFFAKPLPALAPAVQSKSDNMISESLWNSIVSILCVGGLIALFYCLGDMLADLGLFRALSTVFGQSPYTEGICRGILEMTSGCNQLSKLNTPLALALSTGLITFGGICVLMQQITYLSRAGVRTLPFLAVKLLQAVLSFALCYALALLLF